jgi:hypothetical protein
MKDEFPNSTDAAMITVENMQTTGNAWIGKHATMINYADKWFSFLMLSVNR